ncbi:hypothetical protein YYC_03255 [Plasmodium yoelii 17X]|uniref:Uncharacterized protein n=4 Tax=Plasmodium yoelii TaxID=5861 RepID=A0AAF0B5Y1_PLAYO|nr:conserved protein, unknown function [Plasmodium yoelii]EAA18899.1 hypothetical protein [Plasmodium yoelii yoelii]ETB59889.1 hypothetical protein YYC_03255 [Plasmodium yoelii 17X]WBY57780.1 hypothetical protein Py17XNL_001002107 [Plasmodium yoelii yoelii]CDU84889.1 conserved Plasmodium protein, unknown function [Plasmodium yoelii]VTZ78785.1 conserved protein, unknown function [Plasmodium yoelii]|eukprot:XP_727334.1 conserved protein, unknown function [Plasmodium yoelii]
MTTNSCKYLFKQVIKSCNATFNSDIEAKRNVLNDVKNMIREQIKIKEEKDIKQQLIEANDFIKNHIIQAVYNNNTGNYKVELKKEQVQRGSITLGTKIENKFPF